MRWKAYLCCTFLLIGAFLVACGPPADISTASGRIAFVSTRDEPNPECFHCNIEIYVLNADGSGQTRLTNSPAPDQAPTWSPDDKRIAFESWRDGNFEIYVMNADGSGLTNLTNNPAIDQAPTWSPDGKRIAFMSGRDDPDPRGCFACNFEIYVMNADGSGQTNLTNNPADDRARVWSP